MKSDNIRNQTSMNRNKPMSLSNKYEKTKFNFNIPDDKNKEIINFEYLNDVKSRAKM